MIAPGYTLLEEIHRGRRRAVYRAVRQRDGTRVILKTSAAPFPPPDEEAALLREAELLAGIQVAGVVRALGVETLPDRPALVLEDAGGVPLRALLAAGPLDPGRCLRIGSRLAELVGALHRAGVVHRDLNPSNVLVDPVTLAPTLLDFHIATRLASEPQDRATRTYSRERWRTCLPSRPAA